MNVRRIEVDSLSLPVQASIDLPERGLVVVTGPNGAGKSTWLEAVAVAMWGKMLRGAEPFLPGLKGRVRVVSDLAEAQRGVGAKGTKKLEWSLPGKEPVRYDTPTKAQEALEQVVGSFDAWRRTHVFSSQDAAHFSTATDAERKSLLESLLGLEVFDVAYERCRADLRAAEVAFGQREQALVRDEALAVGARRTVDELAAQPDEPEPLVPDEPLSDESVQKEIERVERMLGTAGRELFGLRNDLREAAAKATRALGLLQEAQRRKALFDGGECPTCEQPVSAERLNMMQVGVLALEQEAVSAAKEYARVEEERRMDEAEALEDEGALRGKLAELRAAAKGLAQARADRAACIRARDAWQARQAQRGAQRVNAAQHAQRAEGAAQASRTARDQAGQVLAELQATTSVLGLRGVRSAVLSKALGGIEAVANVWLDRVARQDQPITLRLLPETEGKGGGAREVIRLVVDGVAAGKGYKAASAGQRRRVDIALLLALSEVSGAAFGSSSGDVYFDEVLDTLDQEGVDRMIDVLDDLAMERKVIVITHVDDLARRIPAVLRVKMEGGHVA